MLTIENLGYAIADRPILKAASAFVGRGERIGLVGRNGAGKTTLLRLIAGGLTPDEGSVRLARGTRLGETQQEPPSGPESVVEAVLAADKEASALAKALAEDRLAPEEQAEAHARLAALDHHRAPERAKRILAGLGFDEARQNGPLSALSGGWRMRVALAGLLFTQPDLLLLDEPSNHLDLEASLWLEDFLARYPGSLMLVSHDRRLLDRVPTKILHLDKARLVAYGGNYSTFVETRRLKAESDAAARGRIEAQRKHMQAFVDRFRYKASKAKQAQARLKAIAKLAPPVLEANEPIPRFGFPDPGTLAPPMVTLDGAAVGYRPGQPVLRDLDLRLDPEDRIALLGTNGNGKTTLIRLLAGQLSEETGRVARHPKLAVGHYTQETADGLDPALTPLETLQRLDPRRLETDLRGHLGAFGLEQDRAITPTGQLSGGERARLALAIISRTAPNLLLLDEPTNHLDVESREALVSALGTFPGAVVLVSHDPELVNLVADRLWLVAEGTVRSYAGSIEDYRRDVLAVSAAPAEPASKQAASQSSAARPKAAARRAESAKLRKELAAVERDLEKTATKRDDLAAKLADPQSYDGKDNGAAELSRALKAQSAKIAVLEARWEDLAEALEALDG